MPSEQPLASLGNVGSPEPKATDSPSPSNVPYNEVQAIADRLCEMAADMERFLTQQVHRLEQQLDQPAGAADQSQYEKLYEELQAVRRQWETERDEERERLMAESERLVEAWKKLESEQRELLKQRVLKTAGHDAATHQPLPDGELAPQRASQASRPENGGQPPDPRSPTSRQGQVQFQQLRREMLAHARQRRKR